MTAKEHNKLLSIFFFIQGGLQLIGGIFIALIYGGIGGMMLGTARRSEEQVMGGVFLVVAICLGLFILVFSVFNLVTGFKLLKEQKIARVLGIVASCFALLSFPLGTALGIYGLWFFFGDLGKAFYLNASPQPTFSTQPPAPSSWQ
jgi:hypothetical protein